MTATMEPAVSGRILAPGVIIGAVSGLFAGVIMLVGGAPASWAVTAGTLLALPLAAAGAGCSFLRWRGLLGGGHFAPLALYWVLAFPLVRLVQDVGTRLVLSDTLALPQHLWAFLAYQALISVGFAIGFVWVQERLVRGGARR
ncbi:hypothetical protein GCM10009854_34700 [Saccharopolyspora halophila]|uniref:Uncharacterized protein n=1 Tax=Saccharopolyspora halophila TaxID=405551 RepID=A0ABN3GK04_9PSEU